MKRKNYYMLSRGKYNAKRKARRNANPEKTRLESRTASRKLKGIPEDGPYPPPPNCEACGKALEKPHLDHCHLTGLFRGWLCRECNSALGFVGDSPEGVRKLLTYIESAYTKLQLRLET